MSNKNIVLDMLNDIIGLCQDENSSRTSIKVIASEIYTTVLYYMEEKHADSEADS